MLGELLSNERWAAGFDSQLGLWDASNFEKSGVSGGGGLSLRVRDGIRRERVPKYQVEYGGRAGGVWGWDEGRSDGLGENCIKRTQD